MNGTGRDAEEVPLSPEIADLIARVKAKMAAAPTAEQIRDLAGRAIEEQGRDEMTIAEIRMLADTAVSKARSVEAWSARLARLVTGGTA